MPTKRTPRTPKRRERSVIITPEIIAMYITLVDLFCDKDREKFDDAYMDAHDKLSFAFGFAEVVVEETFLRDVPPDWLCEWLTDEWFIVRAVRLQLDQAANIQWPPG